jgi:hypothetical protein
MNRTIVLIAGLAIAGLSIGLRLSQPHRQPCRCRTGSQHQHSGQSERDRQAGHRQLRPAVTERHRGL